MQRPGSHPGASQGTGREGPAYGAHLAGEMMEMMMMMMS